MVIEACFNWSIFVILSDMIFLGVSQSMYLFMVEQITMTTITMLVAKARAILLQFSPTVITYMELIRWFRYYGCLFSGYKFLFVTILILTLCCFLSHRAIAIKRRSSSRYCYCDCFSFSSFKEKLLPSWMFHYINTILLPN